MISISLWSQGALCLLLSALLPAGAATDGGEPSGGLFRIEDGAVVIDWSPGTGFCLNPPGSWRNLTDSAGEEASSHLPGGGGGGSDLRRSAPASTEGWGVYGGGLGGAHIGWASRGLRGGGHGRPAEYGRRVTDLVGVFSIDMTIKLGSKGPSNLSEAEWIGFP